MLKAMCGVKLLDRKKKTKNTGNLMTKLDLIVLMEMAAKANALRWFGHVLRIEDNSVKMALNFEMRGKRTKG